MAEKTVREILLQVAPHYSNLFYADLSPGASVVRCVVQGYGAPVLICVVDPYAPQTRRVFKVVPADRVIQYDEKNDRLAFLCTVESISPAGTSISYLFELVPLA